MAEADIPEVPTFDIPVRLLGKGSGDHKRPLAHVNEADYKKHYEASIKQTDEFWGKVRTLRAPERFGGSFCARIGAPTLPYLAHHGRRL